MPRTLPCYLILVLLNPAWGQEAAQPVSHRFATAQVDETPDFRRHVVPLLGRLGCNGRACHGSFQGQGGFRLSLFGYDFAADHEALTGGDEPRADREHPEKSLILYKPTSADEHEGGERFKKDSWEHHLLSRWIRSGAKNVAEDHPELAALEVEPREITFHSAGQSASLRIVARWTDGTAEDVTPLCRFQTNDESIASVSEAGVVASVGKGDTHIIVFYDNGIADVPVVLPVSDQTGPRYPEVATPTRIDELVVAKLRTLGIVPSDVCSDAEFLRRVSLDMAGTLPAPDEVTAFLADTSSDKRTRKIDELLERPTYAAWWTTHFCDWTGNTEENLPVGGEQGVRRDKATQWYDWIYRRIAENRPYDELVAGILMATSRREGQTDAEYFAEMSSYYRERDPADFSARESMPHFWTPGRGTPSQTLRVSYAFLGVRLECAECHKHPYDQWTKEDYQGFQAFFDGVRFRQSASRDQVQEMKKTLGLTADQDSGQYKKLFADLAHSGTVVPWGDVSVPQTGKKNAKAKNKSPSGRVITPKLLGGESVLFEEYDDPRQPVMQWLRQSDNPYFARSIVNRIWANYFGVGIVEPPDDMNLANPPSNEPLLSYLAEQFVAHGYDLKWLHREIVSSRTYQLSWRTNETNADDERNFSRALVRRLPAEVAYDALQQATADDESLQALGHDKATVRTRAIGVSSGLSRNPAAYAQKLFGKPSRQVNCDCERSAEPSLLQTIYLRNDAEVLSLLDRRDGWLKQQGEKLDDLDTTMSDSAIRDAYLRTFSRLPSESELETARTHLKESDSPQAGLRDLLWALVNSKEFMLNQ